MGNSASSAGRGQQEESVDYGFLQPQGVYSAPPDWNHSIVSQLMIDRKLAPFYRPLDDYDDSWDDDRVLAARKELPDGDTATSESARADPQRPSHNHNHKRPPAAKEPTGSPEAAAYRGAVECPICFLYYPPNINRSRCCDQAICTECFVRIKRSEPTATHLVSEPAACPYCVQDNFGVTYSPPPWRAGIGSEGSGSPSHPGPSRSVSQQPVDTGSANDPNRGRRKSLSHDNEEVVTIDHIRPDWEAKLAAVRAAVARRANRRIIMRQVGDRLIPVGVTSGRVHPLTADGTAVGEHGEGGDGTGEGRGSNRRSSRRRQQQQQDLNQLLGSMGLGGQDLEELMVMEAMRLSLLEHEEQQRRDAQKKEGERGNADPNGSPEVSTDLASSTLRPELPPIPVSLSADSSLRVLDHSSGVALPSAPAASSLSGNPSCTIPNSHSHQHALDTCSPPGVDSISATSRPYSILSSAPSSRNRTPSPHSRHSGEDSVPRVAPPFSALSAAIAAHSTAAAFLSPNDMPPTGGHTSSGGETSQGRDEGDAPTSSLDTDPNAPEPKQDSLTSIIAHTGITEDASTRYNYDTLASSPESTISHQPLLLPTPATESTDERER